MNTYCRPITRGASWRSQNFGDNATIYGPHAGNDEACPVGTPIHAAGDGYIEWAGQFDDTYSDNLLWLLDMGGNIAVLNCGAEAPSFVYAHLSRFLVKRGDWVRKGQVIAYSGNTGYATTGAHLHVEAVPPGYSLNSPMLGRVNPDRYLTEWPEDIIPTGSAVINPQGTIAPQQSEEDIMAGMTEERLRAIVREEVGLTPKAWFTNKYGTPVQFESLLGQLDLNINQNNANAQAKLDRIVGEVVGLRAAVTALAAGGNVTVDQVDKAIRDALDGFSITLVPEVKK